MNVVERIRQNCARLGGAPALSPYRGGGADVSYAELGRAVENAARQLHELGIGPGAVCGIMPTHIMLHVPLTLALSHLGAASVALRTVADADALDLSAILADHDAPPSRFPVLRIDDRWIASGDGGELPPPHANAPAELCRVFFTSGSTGRPKPIALSYAQIDEHLRQQEATREGRWHALRSLCTVVLDVVLGYLVAVDMLARGGLACPRGPTVAGMAAKIAKHRVQVLHGAPAQLAPICDYARSHRAEFQSLEFVVSGGSPLSRSLAERMRRDLCDRVINNYGSSEAGATASGLVETLDLDRGDVGRVLPGVRVEIVDEDGQPVSAGIGRVRIKSPSMVHGYYRDTDGKVSHFEDGWFYPGDLGSLSPDGMLSVVGRADNVVNLGGKKIAVERIEAMLAAIPGVKEAAVLAVPYESGVDRLVAVIVPGETFLEGTFWKACRAKFAPIEQPVRIVLADEIAHGSSGKIERRLLTGLL